MARRAMLIAGVLVLIAAAVVAVRVVHIHHRYWQWALVPSAAPPKIEVGGRDYKRSAGAAGLDADLVVGAGPRGGVIYGPGGRSIPVTVILRTDDGLVGYSLMGGP
jgi:hypothetical protein